jgi:hypothetical protein
MNTTSVAARCCNAGDPASICRDFKKRQVDVFDERTAGDALMAKLAGKCNDPLGLADPLLRDAGDADQSL